MATENRFVTYHLNAIAKLCAEFPQCSVKAHREYRCREVKTHIAALEGFFLGLQLELVNKQEREI